MARCCDPPVDADTLSAVSVTVLYQCVVGALL